MRPQRHDAWHAEIDQNRKPGREDPVPADRVAADEKVQEEGQCDRNRGDGARPYRDPIDVVLASAGDL